MTEEAAYHIPKPLLHSILSTVISGAIVALLGAVGLSLIGFVTGGSVVKWMGGVTERSDAINFSAAYAETQVPGSKDAKLCALTSVFMPAGGFCYVRYDDQKKAWLMFNRGGSDCSVTCIK